MSHNSDRFRKDQWGIGRDLSNLGTAVFAHAEEFGLAAVGRPNDGLDSLAASTGKILSDNDLSDIEHHHRLLYGKVLPHAEEFGLVAAGRYAAEAQGLAALTGKFPSKDELSDIEHHHKLLYGEVLPHAEAFGLAAAGRYAAEAQGLAALTGKFPSKDELSDFEHHHKFLYGAVMPHATEFGLVAAGPHAAGFQDLTGLLGKDIADDFAGVTRFCAPLIEESQRLSDKMRPMLECLVAEQTNISDKLKPYWEGMISGQTKLAESLRPFIDFTGKNMSSLHHLDGEFMWLHDTRQKILTESDNLKPYWEGMISGQTKLAESLRPFIDFTGKNMSIFHHLDGEFMSLHDTRQKILAEIVGSPILPRGNFDRAPGITADRSIDASIDSSSIINELIGDILFLAGRIEELHPRLLGGGLHYENVGWLFKAVAINDAMARLYEVAQQLYNIVLDRKDIRRFRHHSQNARYIFDVICGFRCRKTHDLRTSKDSERTLWELADSFAVEQLGRRALYASDYNLVLISLLKDLNGVLLDIATNGIVFE